MGMCHDHRQQNDRKTQAVKIGKLAFNTIAVVAIGLIAIIGVAYHFSLELTIANTVENELPLAGDTVYSEIQKDLIRPVYVSSEMANDAFLRDWILGGESDTNKIEKYLSAIRKKHGLVACFFVSASTHRYYYSDGILKTVSRDVPEDTWFFRVSEMKDEFEINVDPDAANDNELTVFVNYRVFDFQGHFIGTTGLGLPLTRVLGSIEGYGSQFKRRILLIDAQGKIIAETGSPHSGYKNVYNRPGLSTLADEIVTSKSSAPRSLQYHNPLTDHITRVNARYLPELGWNLIVEKDDESASVLQIFNFTVPIALLTLAALGALRARTSRIRDLQMLHKAEMLAVTSHDLRHFVHTLYVLLASMTHTCTLRKNTWACMEMEKVVTGLDELISRFLAYYRLDAGADHPKFSAIKLSELVSQLATETMPQLDVQHRGLYFLGVPDCWVSTDPVLLKVILRNFFSNAIKYADKGDVAVEAAINTYRKTVRIEISDSGSALTRRQLRQIFKKFEQGTKQTKAGGIGLGLHLVAHYAEKLGCKVGAHNRKVGKGTTFWIEVPLANEAMVIQAATEEKDVQKFLNDVERPLRDKRIALINPDPVLCDLLGKWGASVSTYPTIETMLAKMDKQESFDGVLIEDQCFDGAARKFSFVTLSERLGDDIPFLLIGGDLFINPGNKLPLHNVRHIPKPIKPAKLKLVIVRAIVGS